MKKKRTPLYVAFIVILLVLIGVCSFFLYYFYDLGKSKFINEVNYEQKSAVNYNVLLDDNKYYDEGAVANVFVTELISKINNYFSYTVSFNDQVKGECNYYIVGSLMANLLSTNENVLIKEVMRSKTIGNKVDGTLINLTDDFDINFTDYLKIFNDFKKDYVLEVNGSLSFDVMISYKVYNEKIDSYIIDKDTLNITIPLGDVTTKISTSEPQSEEKKAYSDLLQESSPLYYAICLEFGGAIILFIILIMVLLKKIVSIDTPYQKTLKKILREYDSIIVGIKDVPNLSSIEVLFVNEFKDLVDAEEELRIPITYTEVIKDHEALFMIIHENRAFVYKLTTKKAK